MKQKISNKTKNIIIKGININNIINTYNKTKITYDNIIIFDKDIYFLEKYQKNSNIHIFPIDIKQNEINTIQWLIQKKIKNIDGIIIYTYEPEKITLLNQINNKKINTFLQKNINIIFLMIKSFINILEYSNNPFITIYLHKNAKNIQTFLSISECINSMITTLTKTLYQEYKNIKDIKINLLSTENINLIYKKKNYTYKKNKNLKNNHNILDTQTYILKKKIKNKFLIL